MDLSSASEFADEYQEWLEGKSAPRRAPWFDVPVGQLEGHPLLVLPPDANVRSAIALMNAHDHGSVLVVRDQRLLGIFTERDVLHGLALDDFDLDRTRVGDTMTCEPEALRTDATLAQAVRALARSRYRHLPVIDVDGRPIAMVSMRRIIQYVCETFPSEILNAPPEASSDSEAPEGA